MDYKQIRTTVAFLVSEIQGRAVPAERLVNFRLDERGGAITLAPDGRKYRFTRGEIQEAYAKITVPADQVISKPVAARLQPAERSGARPPASSKQNAIKSPSGGRDRAKKVATKSDQSRVSTLHSPRKKK